MKSIINFVLVIMALGCTPTKNCKNAICNTMFASVNVNLSDSTNPNLNGISTQTQLLPLGQTIHTQTEPSSSQLGGFTVVDDSDLKELGFNTSHKVELKISKNGTLIKTISYTLTTDCCHVSKTAGPDEVSIN